MPTLEGMRGVWAVRIFGIVTGLMVILTFLFCMIRGSSNSYTYLLGINVILSSLIGGIITRWYSVGELHASKLWFVMVCGCCLLVQAIVYDVFAFHEIPNSSPTTTTELPTTTTTTPTTKSTGVLWSS